jgi:hypothetical protein
VEQTDLLRYTLDALERLGVSYMLVGSFASIAYGEPRLTQDLDIVVDLQPAHVQPLCAAFAAPEFFVNPQAVEDAVLTRFQFNVLHPGSGNKIDFILPRDDAWGRIQLARRQRVLLLPDREGYTARPEDVILGKLWYYSEGGSDKHLRDILGILRVSGAQVDRAEVQRWADALGLSPIWRAILAQESAAPHSPGSE